MRKRDFLLTGLLLVLIGVTIGTLVALYTINDELAPLAEVKTTEINKSSEPFITDEELEEKDARFLFKKIAEEVTPTVVYIEAIIPVDGAIPNDETHNFDSEEDNEESIWDRLMPKRARTVGSGVLISSDGYILTNNHVIEGAVKKGLKVILNDKREYMAKIVGKDSSTDLAVIKIEGENLPTVTVGDSETLDVGEWVLAVGNPFRLRSTVTAGIVSALSREVRIINDRMRIESFIQTDAAINRGNSGGALVNTSGQLIGINTAIASQDGNYQGYGFAVPSNLAIKVAEDIIQYGKFRRGLLGVTISGIDHSRALEKGMNTVRGVEIITVVPGDAADNSGIEAGDVVLAVNGTMVNASNELQQQVAVQQPGDIVHLKIWREGTEIEKQVSLKKMEREEISELNYDDAPLQLEIPENEGANIQFREFDLGFRVMAIEREEEETPEIVVTDVDQYSEAWNRGLKENQKIVSLNKEKVEDLSTLEELLTKQLNKNGSVILGVINDKGAQGYIELKKD
ncbi:MAG: PDZ domain-containing protein [Balneolaceae bacterium]|nr:PDZ domain-containing protein [Balneolaceae bacterium]